MHEVGIAQDVLENVLKELESHEYSKINLIQLLVGDANLLSQESLQHAFDLICVGTKATGAKLEVEQTPGMEIEIKHIEAE